MWCYSQWAHVKMLWKWKGTRLLQDGVVLLSTQRKSSPHLISEGRHHSSKQLTLQISQYVFAGDIELHFQSHIRKYEILRQARF